MRKRAGNAQIGVQVNAEVFKLVYLIHTKSCYIILNTGPVWIYELN
jgi:hypothetical protein